MMSEDADVTPRCRTKQVIIGQRVSVIPPGHWLLVLSITAQRRHIWSRHVPPAFRQSVLLTGVVGNSHVLSILSLPQQEKRPRSVNRPVGVREKTSPRVGLGLWTIISSDEWPHLVKKRETSVSCVCVFFWKKTNKKTPNSMWAAAGTRSPETTKQIQSANSGLLTRLKHSDAGTGLLMLPQDQDPLRHGDKRVIETSTVGSQTYLSCPSLPLSLMRSSQPRPPLGPKPTNSVGWTNTWLALPLMRFTLMSRAADQQTASTLIRPFYTEYTCCLPNTSPKPGTLSIQCCVSTSGRWRYNINVESGAQCFCLHCLNLMWGQLRSQTRCQCALKR